MNTILFRSLSAAAIASSVLTVVGCTGEAQGPAAAQAQERRSGPESQPADAFLQWPLPAGAQAYSAIDGKRIHGYVVEQAAISRRYRDQGHPQFWGRIIGTSADTESQNWLAEKF